MYMHTLKWIVPVVGVISFIMGIMIGIFQTIELAEQATFISHILSSAFSMGMEGVIQTLLWVTIAFVIIEKTDIKKTEKKEWKLEDLPNVTKKETHSIPLSDILVGARLTWFFTMASVSICSGWLPQHILFGFSKNIVTEVFATSFLSTSLPICILIGITGLGEYVCKAIDRRWSIKVCVATILSNIVTTAGVIYLFCQPTILNPAFITSIKMHKEMPSDMMQFMSTRWPLILTGLMVMNIVVFVIECGYAVYKTMQENKTVIR